MAELKKKWISYYLSIAETVASQATCDRKHVGAVIVLNNAIVSTGYNGAPRGLPHCDDVGHDLKDLGGRVSCVRTVHAEANAIAQAARNGSKVEGGTLYTTASPCYDCAKLIINAGISRVVCKEFYSSRYDKSKESSSIFSAAGVDLIYIE